MTRADARPDTLEDGKGQTARDSAENCIQSCSQLDECHTCQAKDLLMIGIWTDRCYLKGVLVNAIVTMNLRDIFASASYAFSFVDKI